MVVIKLGGACASSQSGRHAASPARSPSPTSAPRHRLPIHRLIIHPQVFKVMKSGKRQKKQWKRQVNKVTFVGESFTRKPPKFERFVRPAALRFKKAHVTHPELKATFLLDLIGIRKNPQCACISLDCGLIPPHPSSILIHPHPSLPLPLPPSLPLSLSLSLPLSYTALACAPSLRACRPLSPLSLSLSYTLRSHVVVGRAWLLSGFFFVSLTLFRSSGSRSLALLWQVPAVHVAWCDHEGHHY